MHLSPAFRRLAGPALAVLAAGAPARADDCVVLESRASLAALSGTRIATLAIAPEGPELPWPATAAARLHVVSRPAVIRRQLLFAPGDTVDTLLVGETMRRLRRLRLYSDAVLLAQRCSSSGAAGLVLRTRDTWTLRPTARMRSASSFAFGVEEKNLFGTGRTVAVTSEISRWGNGAAVSFTDPWLFGRDVEASGRLAKLAGGRSLRLGVRNHELSVFDRWRVETGIARVTFIDTGSAERPLSALRGGVLVGRRIASGPTSVTMVLAGAELDSAVVLSPTRRAVIPGPDGATHARSFLGADVGVLHRTAHYDTAGWVVPGRGFLDVPLGWEAEGVVGVGHERDADVGALKLDAWAGRVWIPRRGRILMLDGWVSGYAAHGIDANQIARASAAWYESARRGWWGARLTAERLVEVDPDVRGLSLMHVTDYTAPAVRPYSVRGGAAVAGTAERAVHLFTVGAASVVDAGAFVAGSYRWRVDEVPDGRLGAGVAGARLRVLTANGVVSSVRLDVGHPLLLSAALPRRPFAMVTFGTLFDVSRQRDGRRGL